MFCKNCGHELADDAKFCANCGTGTGENAAPAASAPSPIINDLLTGLKNFFSNKVTQHIDVAAKSNGLEWLIYSLASIIFFALATTLNTQYLFNSNEMVSGIMGYIVSVWSFFPINLIAAAVAFFGIVTGVFLMIRYIFKKEITYVQVLNMVGYAVLPITVVSIANILLGLIYVPLSIVLYIVAVIMTSCLLYIGIQKLDELTVSPLYAFILVMAIAVILSGAVIGIGYSSILEASAQNAVSSLTSGLGSFGDLF